MTTTMTPWAPSTAISAVDGQDEPRHLFAGGLPAQAIRQVDARRLGIIPDMRLWRLPFPDAHLSARTVGHLLDLKTIHDGTPSGTSVPRLAVIV
eukprot:2358764-Prymnesium_polylepis.1